MFQQSQPLDDTALLNNQDQSPKEIFNQAKMRLDHSNEI